jgi:hypothetical protein
MMANNKSCLHTHRQTATDWKCERDHRQLIQPYARHAPWVLRITEHKEKPAPVFIVKKRFYPNGDAGANITMSADRQEPAGRPRLKDQGLLYGQSLRRCLPIVQAITGRVCNDAGIPLELHRFFNNGRITFLGNLPLDEEAGFKLALIFKLAERIKDMDRVELIARRVERFSREEASYWLSRATQYGAAAGRWALAGMRIMLGGQPEDKAVLRMLEKLK